MYGPFRIAIFIAIVSIFLYIANVVAYESLALAFGITATYQLVTLGVSLGVLAAGFIGMMILGSYYYNVFTRTAYLLLAIWMGTFSNLFFASIAFGVVIAVGSLIGASIPFQTIGLGLCAIALLVSIYGAVHARHITPTRYSVVLPNVPAEWKGKKAAWISDLHLGQLHGPAFAAKVTKVVLAQKPDIIFIGGDLYDGTQAPSPAMLAEPLRALTAPWGVYYITGNHEEFGDSNAFLQAVRSLGMQILMDEKVEVHGVQIVGVDYNNANNAGQFAKILSAQGLDSSRPSILLKHEPNNLKIAAEAGISLQISGHTHYGQQWPFGLLAQLSYQGYAYGLKNFGKMQMLTSSGVGTWGPPVRVASRAEVVVVTFI